MYLKEILGLAEKSVMSSAATPQAVDTKEGLSCDPIPKPELG